MNPGNSYPSFVNNRSGDRWYWDKIRKVVGKLGHDRAEDQGPVLRLWNGNNKTKIKPPCGSCTRSIAIFRATRNGVRPISGANNGAPAIAFGGLRSSRRALCVALGLPQWLDAVSHGLAFRLRRRSRDGLRPNARPYAYAGGRRSSLTLPRFPMLLRRAIDPYHNPTTCPGPRWWKDCPW